MMTANRIVRIMAGLMVLISLLLAQLTGQVHLEHPTWLWLTAFVGFNLLQSGITKFCPMDSILARFGVRCS